jgi:hypothetical protein
MFVSFDYHSSGEHIMKYIATTLLLLSLCSTALAGVNVKPGLWEVTAKLKMAYLPIHLPEQVITKCMTEEDLLPVHVSDVPESPCEIISMSIEGNTVEWHVSCDTDRGLLITKGTIEYDESTLSGRGFIKGDAFPGKVVSSMSGKWVESCK